MVKIKQKKQLNLPQLIEWGFENDVTGSIYSDDRFEAKKIRFEVGVIVSMYGDMHKGDTFTVEVEEEITEDTKLPSVLVYDGKYFNALYGLSINDIEKRFIDYVYGVETIHLINGDTHTLIWRDGKLVE